MATHICLGFKEHSIHALPHVVYIGQDGAEMQKAVAEHAKEGYVRMGRLFNPILIPVPIPSLNPKPSPTEAVKTAPAPVAQEISTPKKSKK